MKLCRMFSKYLLSVLFYYLFLWYYTVDQFGFAMLSHDTSIVS